MEITQLHLSDIISFHNYDAPECFERRIKQLQRYNRPILCATDVSDASRGELKRNFCAFRLAPARVCDPRLRRGRTRTGARRWTPLPSTLPPTRLYLITLRTSSRNASLLIPLYFQTGSFRRPLCVLTVSSSDNP